MGMGHSRGGRATGQRDRIVIKPISVGVFSSEQQRYRERRDEPAFKARRAAAEKLWKKRNPERVKEIQRAYASRRNKEEKREYDNNRYQQNKKKLVAYAREWRKRNPEYRKEWYKRRKERLERINDKSRTLETT
ncbi:unnamed protein product [marine sediment metagenome]|uniref:Uncharacterized protein n=1 Tax=marine sediment metagenome TaxID=412755 RepID=X0SMR1_9ZZZZ